MVTLYYVYRDCDEEDIDCIEDNIYLASRDKNGKTFIPVFSADPRRVSNIKELKFLEDKAQVGTINNVKDLKALIDSTKEPVKIGKTVTFNPMKIKIDESPYLKDRDITIDISTVKLYERNQKEIEKSARRCNDIIDFHLQNAYYIDNWDEILFFETEELADMVILFNENKSNNEYKYHYEIISKFKNEYFEEVIDSGECNKISSFEKILKKESHKFITVLERYAFKKILESQEEREYYKNFLKNKLDWEEDYINDFEKKYSKYKNIRIKEIFDVPENDIKELHEVDIPNLGTLKYICKKVNKKKVIYIDLAIKVEDSFTNLKIDEIEVVEFGDEINFIYKKLGKNIELIKHALTIYADDEKDGIKYKTILKNYFKMSNNDIEQLTKVIMDIVTAKHLKK